MNYFFALDMPEHVRNYVANYSLRWRTKIQFVLSEHWLLPEDYHITLKFLGNIAEERVSELVSAAQPIARQQLPLVIHLAPAGKFPSVLWVGVKQDHRLEKLASQIDTALRALGFKPEYRPYRPHITVARILQRQNITGAELLAPYERTFPHWTVGRFVLMQTLPQEQHQNSTKARYNIVHTFPFGNAPSDPHSGDLRRNDVG